VEHIASIFSGCRKEVELRKFRTNLLEHVTNRGIPLRGVRLPHPRP
jgi:hypothetical protein